MDIPPEQFAKRRERVMDLLDDGQVLVVATHPETTYSNDVHHVFRPHSDFWYLSGFAEPEAALAITSDGQTHLWLRPRDPKAEVWNGRRLGIERAAELGFDFVHDSGDLSHLQRMAAERKVLARTVHHPRFHAALGDPADGKHVMESLRIHKDAHEVAMLQRAADIGAEAMREALPLAKPGAHEYAVEAALVSHYRRHGSTGPGYPAIVGAGDNATILHYIENDAAIRAGDLVLVDAGCEWGYYNSDITRTVPASGEFTEPQRQVYDAVWKAQQASIAAVRPGATLRDVHDVAVRSLIDDLVDMGALAGDKDKLFEEDAHRGFYMHGTSHFLGLDVHDIGAYKDDEGNSRTLEPGMCITVEPGLYFNTDFTECPERFAGIGVRLENDLIVTEDGHLDMLQSLPTSPDDVLEVFCR